MSTNQSEEITTKQLYTNIALGSVSLILGSPIAEKGFLPCAIFVATVFLPMSLRKPMGVPRHAILILLGFLAAPVVIPFIEGTVLDIKLF
jgi:hypothetical protein